MFSRPKILFLVSLLLLALLNPKFNPYLLFKFLIFYHSSNNSIYGSWLENLQISEQYYMLSGRVLIAASWPHDSLSCTIVS